MLQVGIFLSEMSLPKPDIGAKLNDISLHRILGVVLCYGI